VLRNQLGRLAGPNANIPPFHDQRRASMGAAAREARIAGLAWNRSSRRRVGLKMTMLSLSAERAGLFNENPVKASPA
jgi:hypothetical protein